MSTDVTIADDISDQPQQRRVMLPAVLFLATCLSTFWVGAVAWKPIVHLEALNRAITLFIENLHKGLPTTGAWDVLATMQIDWQGGLLYMAAVLGILLTHEMGHFLTTLRYRIPASLPYFIPVPVIPFGTMGAVIGMDGSQAKRRELFDMGIAGPLAGLIVVIPITLLGIRELPVSPHPGDSLCFHNPLLFQYLIAWLRPDYPTPAVLYLNQFNACLMAGWMGMLVTGFNMLPVGQLDGGHVAYALMGKRGHLLARGLLIAAILFIVFGERYEWVIMVIVVTLLGADHPPTADDNQPLGWTRRAIGWASLLIPFLCFPPLGITPIVR